MLLSQTLNASTQGRRLRQCTLAGPWPPGSAHSSGMRLVSQRLHFHKHASCPNPLFSMKLFGLCGSLLWAHKHLSWTWAGRHVFLCFFPPNVCGVIGQAGPASAQLLSLVRLTHTCVWTLMLANEADPKRVETLAPGWSIITVQCTDGRLFLTSRSKPQDNRTILNKIPNCSTWL